MIKDFIMEYNVKIHCIYIQTVVYFNFSRWFQLIVSPISQQPTSEFTTKIQCTDTLHFGRELRCGLDFHYSRWFQLQLLVPPLSKQPTSEFTTKIQCPHLNFGREFRTVHTDSTLWKILAFRMRKWFPNIFESLYLHINRDLIELYISKK